MQRIFCPSCRLDQPISHRFCVRCGSELPAYLLEARPVKAVQWFAGVRGHEPDVTSGFLRVSCYLTEDRLEDGGASALVPGRHVRFSVWDGEQARCAVSLPETEAVALARFIERELEDQDHRLATGMSPA